MPSTVKWVAETLTTLPPWLVESPNRMIWGMKDFQKKRG
jgi:hypothetical protein